MDKEEIIKVAETIQGWMSPEELGVLYDLSQSVLVKDSLAVEIGSWKGRSAYVLGSVCKQKAAKLICIDTFCGCYSQKELYEEAMKAGVKKFIEDNIAKNTEGLPVDFVVGDSTEVHEHIANEALSFCFIDGDHFNPGVKQDLENFWPKVKKGGIFAGHDYAREFPDVVSEVNKKYTNLITREVKYSIWFVRKK